MTKLPKKIWFRILALILAVILPSTDILASNRGVVYSDFEKEQIPIQEALAHRLQGQDSFNDRAMQLYTELRLDKHEKLSFPAREQKIQPKKTVVPHTALISHLRSQIDQFRAHAQNWIDSNQLAVHFAQSGFVGLAFGFGIRDEGGPALREYIDQGFAPNIAIARYAIGRLAGEPDPSGTFPARAIEAQLAAIKSGDAYVDLKDLVSRIEKGFEGHQGSLPEYARFAMDVLQNKLGSFDPIKFNAFIDRIVTQGIVPLKRIGELLVAARQARVIETKRIEGVVLQLFERGQPWIAGLVALEAIKAGEPINHEYVRRSVRELTHEAQAKGTKSLWAYAGELIIQADNLGIAGMDRRRALQWIRNNFDGMTEAGIPFPYSADEFGLTGIDSRRIIARIEKLFRKGPPYAGQFASEAIRIRGDWVTTKKALEIIARLRKEEEAQNWAANFALGALKQGKKIPHPLISELIDISDSDPTYYGLGNTSGELALEAMELGVEGIHEARILETIQHAFDNGGLHLYLAAKLASRLAQISKDHPRTKPTALKVVSSPVPYPTGNDKILATLDRGVVTVLPNVPQARNALDSTMVRSIAALAQQLDFDPKVQAVVFRGAPDPQGKMKRVLTGGGDLKERHGLVQKADTPSRDALLSFVREKYIMLDAIYHMRKPVITLVDTMAVGGGLGIALASDLAFTDLSAIALLPETHVGYFADAANPRFIAERYSKHYGMSHPKLARSFAKYYAFTGKPIRTVDALVHGLFYDAVLDLDEVEAALKEIVDRTVSGKDEILDELKKTFSKRRYWSSYWNAIHPSKLEMDYMYKYFNFDTAEEILSALIATARRPSLDDPNADWGEEPPQGTFEWFLKVKRIMSVSERERDFARETLQMIIGRSPLAISVTNQVIEEGLRETDRRKIFDIDIRAAEQMIGSGDLAEGLNAFVERRAPAFPSSDTPLGRLFDEAKSIVSPTGFGAKRGDEGKSKREGHLIAKEFRGFKHDFESAIFSGFAPFFSYLEKIPSEVKEKNGLKRPKYHPLNATKLGKLSQSKQLELIHRWVRQGRMYVNEIERMAPLVRANAPQNVRDESGQARKLETYFDDYFDTLLPSIIDRARNMLEEFFGQKRAVEMVDVNRVIAEVERLAYYNTVMLMNYAHVEAIRLNLSPELPGVLANRAEVNRVISNLLWNAMQAATDKVEVSISTFYDAPKGEIVITVSDTGPGILRENLPRIWEEGFSQKPAGTPPGEGLGLANSKRIIESYGGRIDVDSRTNVGTTFTVRLPVSQAVTVLGAGGTIDMAGERGRQAADAVTAILSGSGESVHYEKVFERAPDSSNLEPDDWETIISHIRAKLATLKDTDPGIVITAGTDRLTELALALSLEFSGDIAKKIILTAAGAPADQEGSDAQVNLKNAIKAARNKDLPNQVYVLIGGDLHLASRIEKIQFDNQNTFFKKLHQAAAGMSAYWPVRREISGKYIVSYGGAVGQIKKDGVIELDAEFLHWVNNHPSVPATTKKEEFGYVEHHSFRTPTPLKVLEDARDRILRLASVQQRVGMLIEGNFEKHPEIEKIRDLMRGLHNAKIPILVTDSKSRKALENESFKPFSLPETLTPAKSRTKLSWLLRQGISYENLEAELARDYSGEVDRPQREEVWDGGVWYYTNDYSRGHELIINGQEVVISFPGMHRDVIADALKRLRAERDRTGKKRYALLLYGYGSHLALINKNIHEVLLEYLQTHKEKRPEFKTLLQYYEQVSKTRGPSSDSAIVRSYLTEAVALLSKRAKIKLARHYAISKENFDVELDELRSIDSSQASAQFVRSALGMKLFFERMMAGSRRRISGRDLVILATKEYPGLFASRIMQDALMESHPTLDDIGRAVDEGIRVDIFSRVLWAQPDTRVYSIGSLLRGVGVHFHSYYFNGLPGWSRNALISNAGFGAAGDMDNRLERKLQLKKVEDAFERLRNAAQEDGAEIKEDIGDISRIVMLSNGTTVQAFPTPDGGKVGKYFFTGAGGDLTSMSLVIVKESGERYRLEFAYTYNEAVEEGAKVVTAKKEGVAVVLWEADRKDREGELYKGYIRRKDKQIEQLRSAYAELLKTETAIGAEIEINDVRELFHLPSGQMQVAFPTPDGKNIGGSNQEEGRRGIGASQDLEYISATVVKTADEQFRIDFYFKTKREKLPREKPAGISWDGIGFSFPTDELHWSDRDFRSHVLNGRIFEELLYRFLAHYDDNIEFEHEFYLNELSQEYRYPLFLVDGKFIGAVKSGRDGRAVVQSVLKLTRFRKMKGRTEPVRLIVFDAGKINEASAALRTTEIEGLQYEIIPVSELVKKLDPSGERGKPMLEKLKDARRLELKSDEDGLTKMYEELRGEADAPERRYKKGLRLYEEAEWQGYLMTHFIRAGPDVTMRALDALKLNHSPYWEWSYHLRLITFLSYIYQKTTYPQVRAKIAELYPQIAEDPEIWQTIVRYYKLLEYGPDDEARVASLIRTTEFDDQTEDEEGVDTEEGERPAEDLLSHVRPTARATAFDYDTFLTRVTRTIKRQAELHGIHDLDAGVMAIDTVVTADVQATTLEDTLSEFAKLFKKTGEPYPAFKRMSVFLAQKKEEMKSITIAKRHQLMHEVVQAFIRYFTDVRRMNNERFKFFVGYKGQFGNVGLGDFLRSLDASGELILIEDKSGREISGSRLLEEFISFGQTLGIPVPAVQHLFHEDGGEKDLQIPRVVNLADEIIRKADHEKLIRTPDDRRMVLGFLHAAEGVYQNLKINLEGDPELQRRYGGRDPVRVRVDKLIAIREGIKKTPPQNTTQEQIVEVVKVAQSVIKVFSVQASKRPSMYDLKYGISLRTHNVKRAKELIESVRSEEWEDGDDEALLLAYALSQTTAMAEIVGQEWDREDLKLLETHLAKEGVIENGALYARVGSGRIRQVPDNPPINILNEGVYEAILWYFFPEITPDRIRTLARTGFWLYDRIQRENVANERVLDAWRLLDAVALRFFDTTKLKNSKKIVQNRFHSAELVKVYRGIREWLQKQNVDTSHVNYPFSGADITTALLLTDADVIRMYDQLPFGLDKVSRDYEPWKISYISQKVTTGYIMDTVTGAIGHAKTPLLWELEALGAKDIRIESDDEDVNTYRIYFTWAYDEGEAPRERVIEYREWRFLKQKDYDEAVDPDHDTVLIDKGSLSGIKSKVLPNTIISFNETALPGFKRHPVHRIVNLPPREKLTMMAGSRYDQITSGTVLVRGDENSLAEEADTDVTELSSGDIEIIQNSIVMNDGKAEIRRADGGHITLVGESDLTHIFGKRLPYQDIPADLKFPEIPPQWYVDKDVIVVSGQGNLPFLLKERGARSVTVIDLDPAVIAWQRAKMVYASDPAVGSLIRDEAKDPGPSARRLFELITSKAPAIGPLAGMRFEVGDLTKKLLLEDSSADLVIVPFLFGMQNGITTVDGYQRAMAELLRIAKPDGRTVIFPSRISDRSNYHEKHPLKGFDKWLTSQRALGIEESPPMPLYNLIDDSRIKSGEIQPPLGHYVILEDGNPSVFYGDEFTEISPDLPKVYASLNAETRGYRRQFGEYYRSHVEKVHGEILKGARGLSGTALILGIGNGIDYPLRQLAEQFDRVVVVDLDVETAKQTISKLDPALRRKFEIRAEDLTSMLAEFSHGVDRAVSEESDKNVAMRRIAELANTIQFGKPPLKGLKASYVISSSTMTQLTSSAQQYAIKKMQEKFRFNDPTLAGDQEFFDAFRENLNSRISVRHVENLQAWALPKGKVYFSETLFETSIKREPGGSSVPVSDPRHDVSPDAFEKLEALFRKDIDLQAQWFWNNPPPEIAPEGRAKSEQIVSSVLSPRREPRKDLESISRPTSESGISDNAALKNKVQKYIHLWDEFLITKFKRLSPTSLPEEGPRHIAHAYTPEVTGSPRTKDSQYTGAIQYVDDGITVYDTVQGLAIIVKNPTDDEILGTALPEPAQNAAEIAFFGTQNGEPIIGATQYFNPIWNRYDDFLKYLQSLIREKGVQIKGMAIGYQDAPHQREALHHFVEQLSAMGIPSVILPPRTAGGSMVVTKEGFARLNFKERETHIRAVMPKTEHDPRRVMEVEKVGVHMQLWDEVFSSAAALVPANDSHEIQQETAGALPLQKPGLSKEAIVDVLKGIVPDSVKSAKQSAKKLGLVAQDLARRTSEFDAQVVTSSFQSKGGLNLPGGIATQIASALNELVANSAAGFGVMSGYDFLDLMEKIAAVSNGISKLQNLHHEAFVEAQNQHGGYRNQIERYLNTHRGNFGGSPNLWKAMDPQTSVQIAISPSSEVIYMVKGEPPIDLAEQQYFIRYVVNNAAPLWKAPRGEELALKAYQQGNLFTGITSPSSVKKLLNPRQKSIVNNIVWWDASDARRLREPQKVSLGEFVEAHKLKGVTTFVLQALKPAFRVPSEPLSLKRIVTVEITEVFKGVIYFKLPSQSPKDPAKSIHIEELERVSIAPSGFGQATATDEGIQEWMKAFDEITISTRIPDRLRPAFEAIARFFIEDLDMPEEPAEIDRLISKFKPVAKVYPQVHQENINDWLLWLVARHGGGGGDRILMQFREKVKKEGKRAIERQDQFIRQWSIADVTKIDSEHLESPDAILYLKITEGLIRLGINNPANLHIVEDDAEAARITKFFESLKGIGVASSGFGVAHEEAAKLAAKGWLTKDQYQKLIPEPLTAELDKEYYSMEGAAAFLGVMAAKDISPLVEKGVLELVKIKGKRKRLIPKASLERFAGLRSANRAAQIIGAFDINPFRTRLDSDPKIRRAWKATRISEPIKGKPNPPWMVSIDVINAFRKKAKTSIPVIEALRLLRTEGFDIEENVFYDTIRDPAARFGDTQAKRIFGRKKSLDFNIVIATSRIDLMDFNLLARLYQIQKTIHENSDFPTVEEMSERSGHKKIYTIRDLAREGTLPVTRLTLNPFGGALHKAVFRFTEADLYETEAVLSLASMETVRAAFYKAGVFSKAQSLGVDANQRLKRWYEEAGIVIQNGFYRTKGIPPYLISALVEGVKERHEHAVGNRKLIEEVLNSARFRSFIKNLEHQIGTVKVALWELNEKMDDHSAFRRLRLADKYLKLIRAYEVALITVRGGRDKLLKEEKKSIDEYKTEADEILEMVPALLNGVPIAQAQRTDFKALEYAVLYYRIMLHHGRKGLGDGAFTLPSMDAIYEVFGILSNGKSWAPPKPKLENDDDAYDISVAAKKVLAAAIQNAISEAAGATSLQHISALVTWEELLRGVRKRLKAEGKDIPGLDEAFSSGWLAESLTKMFYVQIPDGEGFSNFSIRVNDTGVSLDYQSSNGSKAAQAGFGVAEGKAIEELRRHVEWKRPDLLVDDFMKHGPPARGANLPMAVSYLLIQKNRDHFLSSLSDPALSQQFFSARYDEGLSVSDAHLKGRPGTFSAQKMGDKTRDRIIEHWFTLANEWKATLGKFSDVIGQSMFEYKADYDATADAHFYDVLSRSAALAAAATEEKTLTVFAKGAPIRGIQDSVLEALAGIELKHGDSMLIYYASAGFGGARIDADEISKFLDRAFVLTQRGSDLPKKELIPDILATLEKVKQRFTQAKQNRDAYFSAAHEIISLMLRAEKKNLGGKLWSVLETLVKRSEGASLKSFWKDPRWRADIPYIEDQWSTQRKQAFKALLREEYGVTLRQIADKMRKASETELALIPNASRWGWRARHLTIKDSVLALNKIDPDGERRLLENLIEDEFWILKHQEIRDLVFSHPNGEKLGATGHGPITWASMIHHFAMKASLANRSGFGAADREWLRNGVFVRENAEKYDKSVIVNRTFISEIAPVETQTGLTFLIAGSPDKLKEVYNGFTAAKKSKKGLEAFPEFAAAPWRIVVVSEEDPVFAETFSKKLARELKTPVENVHAGNWALLNEEILAGLLKREGFVYLGDEEGISNLPPGIAESMHQSSIDYSSRLVMLGKVAKWYKQLAAAA